MKWYDDEAWETKFARLLARIDELHAAGHAIGLVGVSAGASAAINAFAARKDKIAGVVLLAGKVNRPNAIGANYRQRNPSFITSAYAAPESLRALNSSLRKKILSRFALKDGVVAREDSLIDGASNQMLLSVGHAPTIALQITFGAPLFLRFLKKQVS